MQIEAEDLPLSTLLSLALVALTIELDHGFEQRMPHFTTASRKQGAARVGGVWLTSFAMWANFLRFVDEAAVAGTPLADIQSRSRTSDGGLHVAVAGMHRWGYIVPDAPKRPTAVRVTPLGRQANEIWRAVPAEVDARWSQRFGGEIVRSLRSALTDLSGRVEDPTGRFPAFLPIARYPTVLRVELLDDVAPPTSPPDREELGLASALAVVLLALTLEFERRSELSLAIAANTLRAVTTDGILFNDLPRVTGASKEATAFCVGSLEKSGRVTVTGTGRSKAVALTHRGAADQATAHQTVRQLEAEWRQAHGDDRIDALRRPLEAIVVTADLARSPLRRAIEAPAGSWRAAAPSPDTLPHHPLVLHRGGYPDGA